MIEWLIAFVCSGILIYFWIQYWTRTRAWIVNSPNLDVSMLTPGDPISVILCTHGYAPKLLTYLPKTLSQKGLKYEVIVVADSLQADVYQSLMDLAHIHHTLTILNITDLDLPYLHKKRSLDYGIAHAQYPIVVTIDDDCYPESEHWLLSISHQMALQSLDVWLGVSPMLSHRSLLAHFMRYGAIATIDSYISATIRGKAYMGVGRNMAFRKSLWTREYLNQYAHIGHADDDSIVIYAASNGAKIGYGISPKVYTYPLSSWWQWLKQRSRHVSSGQIMNRTTLINLAIPPFLTQLFWVLMWYWVSYGATHVSWFVIAFGYCAFVMWKTFSIESKLNLKHKLWIWAVPLDWWHSFTLLVLPFVSLLRSNQRWS